MYKQIKYFKGLNALRFFAAYLVVLHHAEQIRLKNDIFNLKSFSLFNNGGLAVTFFFVLSGFLISYLLLKELKQTNKVSIKKFYTRRILRIWPLYFLLVIIGTLIVPYFLSIINHAYEMPYRFQDVILYYVFFSPFMVNVLFGHHLLEPLWSIGVEELFYIIWAPLFNFLKNHILKIILTIIILKVSILSMLHADIFQLSPIIVQVIGLLQFEAMAIGGFVAYLLYHRKKNIESSFIFSRPVEITLISFILLRIVADRFLSEKSLIFEHLFHTPVASSIIIMMCFAWLIVNISVNRKAVIKLNNKLFNFLGDISYGIYMYHLLIVFGIILFLKKYLATMPDFVGTIFFYLVLTSVVILISFLSKTFFEGYFLKIKGRFRDNK